MTVSVKGKKRIPSARSIGGWEDYLRDGESYLKTAAGAFEKQKKAFTPEILYNIIAMAIEKFIMAALMRHGALPYNHTMRDLVEAMDTAFPSLIDDLKERLLRMDRYHEICDLYGFTIVPPESSEIPDMLNTAQKLKRLVTV